MKFIRDIISERAEMKTVKSEPAPGLPLSDLPAPALTPAPGVVSDLPAEIRCDDRTMTRLSAPVSMSDDDVFARLLSEAAASSPPEAPEAPAAPLAPADPGMDVARAEPEDRSDTLYSGGDAPYKQADHEDRKAGPLNLDRFEKIDSSLAPDPEHTALRSAELAPEAPAAPEMPALRREPSAPPVAVTGPGSADPDGSGPAAEAPMRKPDPVRDHMDQRVASHPAEAQTSTAHDPIVAVPAPASGRSGRGAGRVKTRLLGFGAPQTPVDDVFEKDDSATAPSAVTADATFPVGWLVIIAGPGRGHAFAMYAGVSQIGRGEDQTIRLDFGDTSISRANHAAIAYDIEQDKFYIGHGGKANMVRLNDRPVLSTEDLPTGATIRIGETTLRFVALCDGTFSWSERDG